MATFVKPNISGLRIVFHEFMAPTQRPNSYTGQMMNTFGKKKPGLDVDIDLYLTPTKNIGRQTYSFLQKETPAVPSSHDGLPMCSDVIPDGLAVALKQQFGVVIDLNLPQYTDESSEIQEVGVKVYPRINAIDATLPPEDSKASERSVSFIIGLYEDEACTRQIVNADFVVVFADDAFLARQFNVNVDDMNPDAVARIRSENTCYPLTAFLQRSEIMTAIGALGQSIFATLISRVNQWKHMNLPSLMASFQQSFSSIANLPPPQPQQEPPV